MQLLKHGVLTLSAVLATLLCECSGSGAHASFKDILAQWRASSSAKARRTNANPFPRLSNIHLDAETLKSFFFSSSSPHCSTRNTEGVDVPFSLSAFIDTERVQNSGELRLAVCSSQNHNATYHFERTSIYQKPVAEANWTETINATGWSHLTVKTRSDSVLNDSITAYAAGVLEGILTSCRISQFFSNTQDLLRRTPETVSTRQTIRNTISHFIENAFNELGESTKTFERRTSASQEPSGPMFKAQVANVLFQIWGITDGYSYTRKYFSKRDNAASWPNIDLVDMILLSEDGDYAELSDATRRCEGCNTSDYGKPDLQASIVAHAQRHLKEMKSPAASRDNRQGALPELGRCSALVRVTSDASNLFVGHATWEPYSEMTRVLKYYIFPFEGVAASVLAMTSYPGAVTSTDDFILTSQELVITETTIDIPNRSIVTGNHLEKGRLPDFMAPLVAARLARSAKEWATFYTQYRTFCQGVSSSQWMVVDYKKWKKPTRNLGIKDLVTTRRRAPKAEEVLFVIESVPGLAISEDKTNFLYEHGFWGSVNSASFGAIKDHIKSDGSANPRSFTLQQLAPKVNTLEDMMRIMQFSSAREKQSGGIPSGYFIAPRFDLVAPSRFPQGATDAKVISAELVDRLQFWAISGPEHQQNVPFDWEDVDSRERKRFGNLWPHTGMPRVWNFTWQLVTSCGTKSRKTSVDQAEGIIRRSSIAAGQPFLGSTETTAGWEDLLIRALSSRGRRSRWIDKWNKIL